MTRRVERSTVGPVTDEARPYGGGTDNPALKRVRTRHFQRAKEEGIKITGRFKPFQEFGHFTG